ncbi:MAG: stage III sporulation protein AF [Clostridia bacterium]|nr:stage III sporulation protein AF [Clostridia bacterium]
MVEKISNFTMTMICTIMMIVIIKMIIPEGKHKKYILFVCSMITTLVMIEPLLSFLNLDINEVLAKNEVKYEEYQIDESLYQNAIKDSYEKSLIQDVINRLKENGYNVSDLKVEYDKVSYKPTKIYLRLEDEDGYVQPVKIEVSKNESSSIIDEITKSRIQEILKNNYGIDKNSILIERSSK